MEKDKNLIVMMIFIVIFTIIFIVCKYNTLNNPYCYDTNDIYKCLSILGQDKEE